jgi:serine/threonine-protein kinase
LIEQGASQKKKSLRSQFFLAALEEFGKLRHTPGAPLEYLGKSLVYKADQELEEEVKCLELAIRKYPSNPLSPQLADHIVFRLHESSAKDRKATYHLALLCLRQLPNVFAQESHRPLLQSLETHIEKPSFLKNLPKENTSLSILLAFWLGKPITLVEIIEQLSAQPKENSLLIMSALFALLHLGYAQWASENSQVLQDNVEVHPLLQIALTCHEKKISQSLEKFFLLPSKPFTFLHFQTFTYVVETAIAMHKSKEVLPFFAKLPKEIPTEERMYIDALHIYCLLLQDDSKQCESIFQNYPKETIEKENSPLRSLYGCYLAKTTGEKKALQFLTTTSQKLYPPSSNLLSYSLSGHLNSNHRWDKEAFFWEKKELYRQLFVYFHCLKEEKEEKKIQAHLQKWKKAPLDT